MADNWRLATAYALEIEPMRVERTLPPDRPSEGTLDITNPSSEAVQVRVQAGRYRFLQPELNLPSAETWLTFEPAAFTLAPGASASLAYTVTPPASVAQDRAGEYLAAILIDELPTHPSEINTDSQSRIAIVPRLALPVYFKIEGKERVEVHITELSIEGIADRQSPSSDQNAPSLIRITTSLRNDGTVHVRPSGSLALFEPSGSVVGARPLGRSLPLFPNATLDVATLVPLPPPGWYRAVVTIDPEEGDLLQREVAFAVTSDGNVHQAR